MQKPIKISQEIKDKITLWLINERHYTPDQAVDEVDNFPNYCLSLWLERSTLQKIKDEKND